MDPLTPELERRLQVEELWVRRNVLLDSINARRREHFRTRYVMLARLGTQALPLPVHVIPEPAVEDAPQPMRPLPQEEPHRTRRLMGFGGLAIAAALALMVGLRDDQLMTMVQARFAAYVPYLSQLLPHHAEAPHAVVHAAARLPDLRAQVRAEIAAAISGKRPAPGVAVNTVTN
jgi:hypothetical protein